MDLSREAFAEVNKSIVAVTAALSAVAAAATTWVVAQQRFNKLLDERLEQETEAVRKLYAARTKSDEFATVDDAYKALIGDEVILPLPDGTEIVLPDPGTLQPEKYAIDYDDVPANVQVRPNPLSRMHDPMAADEPEPTRNAFEDAEAIADEYEDDGDFDHEEEMRHRDPNVPYVVSHSEFVANPDHHAQEELTYYPNEDILITEDNSEPVADPDSAVGEDNLTKFGHGSNDPNIVYIRNERISTDFTVVKSKGSFNKEVYGFIEHSDMDRRPRKFRGDRE